MMASVRVKVSVRMVAKVRVRVMMSVRVMTRVMPRVRVSRVARAKVTGKGHRECGDESEG